MHRPARLPERTPFADPLGTNPVDHCSVGDRRSVGDRTPGLVLDADAGLTLHVRHERPDDPCQAANWLPAPYGPFTAVLRIYGPGPAVLDGTWTLPGLSVREHGRHGAGGGGVPGAEQAPGRESGRDAGRGYEQGREHGRG